MSDSASKAAEGYPKLYGHNKRTIEIEPETWEELNRWSEQECRTVAGQIKYLVKTHLPPQLRLLATPRPSQLKPPKPLAIPSNKDGWESVPFRQRRLKPDTQRMAMLELMKEYEETVTNSEILLLLQAKFPQWTSLDIDVISKQTSNMYYSGLIKRRINENMERGDRYQYCLRPQAIKLITRMNIKYRSY
jgi:hypothetical protein